MFDELEDLISPFLYCAICGTTIKATDSGLCWDHKYDEQFTPVPVRDYSRQCAIIDLNGPIPNCKGDCSYGGCFGGCGSCCYCIGGCVVEYENYCIAPFVWEGDNA